MQNKRASLNIQQEKVQFAAQHLASASTSSFHFWPPSRPLSFPNFYYFIQPPVSLRIIPRRPSHFIFSPLDHTMTEKVNISSVRHRRAFYLFIVKYTGNEGLKRKHSAFITGEWKENFHRVRALKALCRATKRVKRYI